jgi:hypothetical protein
MKMLQFGLAFALGHSIIDDQGDLVFDRLAGPRGINQKALS